jgi:flagellar hook assembly protein FlgD
MCSKSNLTTSDAQEKRRPALREVYSSESYEVYSRTLNQLCPGTYTFTWDGTVNRTSYPPNNIAPAGLYTFDITVNGKTPDGLVLNDDKDRMISEIITVSQTSLDIDEEIPCNFKFGYVL